MPETQLWCWGLAYAYRALFSTLKGKRKVSGSEDIQTALARPETQPSTISVALIVKKKQWKRKSTHLLREEEASPESRRENPKRQPVLQQCSHKNRRGKRQKSSTSWKPPGH